MVLWRTILVVVEEDQAESIAQANLRQNFNDKLMQADCLYSYLGGSHAVENISVNEIAWGSYSKSYVAIEKKPVSSIAPSSNNPA